MTDASLPSQERLAFMLADVLEEDDFPLWEFVWHLNRLAPDASLDDKSRVARRAQFWTSTCGAASGLAVPSLA